MNDALLVFMIAIGLIMAVALYASGLSIRCVVCGRRCGGRIAGGTVDAPECVECVRRRP